MREVKFRAWDKKNKQIAEVLAIDYLANEVMLDHFGEIYFLDFKYVELLQYTGLKDENGVEIYEGDIIFSECGEQNYLEISFWTGKFIALYNNFVLELFDLNERSYIAGNVFENAELLELQNMPF